METATRCGGGRRVSRWRHRGVLQQLTTRRTSSLRRRPLLSRCAARAYIYNSLTKRRRWWWAGWSSMQSHHQQQQQQQQQPHSQAGIGLTRVLDNRVQTRVSLTPTDDKSTELTIVTGDVRRPSRPRQPYPHWLCITASRPSSLNTQTNSELQPKLSFTSISSKLAMHTLLHNVPTAIVLRSNTKCH